MTKRYNFRNYDTVQWEPISTEDRQLKLWVVVTVSCGGGGGIRYGDDVRDVRSKACKDCFVMESKDWDKRLPWVAMRRVGYDEFVVIDVDQLLSDGKLCGSARILAEKHQCPCCGKTERFEDTVPFCRRCGNGMDHITRDEDCDDEEAEEAEV